MLADVQTLLSRANVNIQSQGIEEIAIYCPFHRNVDSASCYINTKTGLWQCFNPSCGAKGNYRQLHRRLLNEEVSEKSVVDPQTLKFKLNKALTQDEELELSMDNLTLDYEEDSYKLETLLNRGFELDTLEYFEVGFSDRKQRIVIPIRDGSYKIVGMIGRATREDQEPRYLYTTGFKRAKVLFNLCNAKQYDSVIVTEGSLDTMKVHQAGFPNTVATLGSKISEIQFLYLRKCFNEIIIFSDNDVAGEAMKCSIMVSCRGWKIRQVDYPDGRSDPGDMTGDEICQAVNNSKITI